jgi:hypothetical protein
MGGRALMMTMVSAPAISAGARVRAVAAVMSQVLAVAFETVWIRRKTFLSFTQ